MSYRKIAHSVFDLKYLLVGITRLPRLVLWQEIAAGQRELTCQTGTTLGVDRISGHVSADHVHELVTGNKWRRRAECGV